MPIQAVEPRRLYRQVADQLRQLINAGEFPVGTRLPTERELADQLGISRPTVREALIALEVEGRIRIRVGSGIFVNAASEVPPPTPDSNEGPFELLRAREFIEGAIASEAAVRASASDVEKLDNALRRMEAVGDAAEEAVPLDREFHITVAGILGNAVLVRSIGELFDQRMNPYFERLSRYFENKDSWRSAVQEHRAVRDAIAAHDPEGAKAAMQKHLQLSQTRFSQNFGEDS
jgi:DNA-binding FadR family transcriptional regulator